MRYKKKMEINKQLKQKLENFVKEGAKFSYSCEMILESIVKNEINSKSELIDKLILDTETHELLLSNTLDCQADMQSFFKKRLNELSIEKILEVYIELGDDL